VTPAKLESQHLAELHARAAELGVPGFRRMRRDELIAELMARDGGEAAPEEAEAERLPAEEADVQIAEEAEAPAAEEAEDEQPQDAEPPARKGRGKKKEEEEGEGGGRRRRRRRLESR
jgi:Rho termination factor, N-terminal domain.